MEKDRHIYYCPNCNSTYSDEAGKVVSCPECKRFLIEKNILLDDWRKYSQSQKDNYRHRFAEEERRRQAENKQKAAGALKNAGGYWEYKIVNLLDQETGSIMPEQLEQTMNELGQYGWRLRCAYTNEIGRTSTPGGFFGLIPTVNATIDQNILIFERFVKQDA